MSLNINNCLLEYFESIADLALLRTHTWTITKDKTDNKGRDLEKPALQKDGKNQERRRNQSDTKAEKLNVYKNDPGKIFHATECIKKPNDEVARVG